MDAETTGTYLAALRKAKGLTQQDAAEALNLSNKTISKWESGAGLPDITVLPALAELYGVSADDILAGETLDHEEVHVGLGRGALLPDLFGGGGAEFVHTVARSLHHVGFCQALHYFRQRAFQVVALKTYHELTSPQSLSYHPAPSA